MVCQPTITRRSSLITALIKPKYSLVMALKQIGMVLMRPVDERTGDDLTNADIAGDSTSVQCKPFQLQCHIFAVSVALWAGSIAIPCERTPVRGRVHCALPWLLHAWTPERAALVLHIPLTTTLVLLQAMHYPSYFCHC